jgi:sugar-specific transcriptional regulator TrmB
VTPDRAISILLEHFSHKLQELEERKSNIVNSLAAIASTFDQETAQGFTLITGGGNLIARAKQLVIDARFDYAGVISKYGLRRILSNGVARALVVAKNRYGLCARIISEIDETNVKTAKYLSGYFEVRRCKGLQYYLDIVDKKTVVLGPAVTDEEATELNRRELDLLTTNARFVQGMSSMFEQLWKASPRYIPK